jgi:hypothetical protein
MPFQMSDIPISDPKIAAILVRSLQTCGRAFDEALIETEKMMPTADWNLLRRGVGQIMGSDMYDLWAAIVKRHPQFEKAALGDDFGTTKGPG